MYCGLFHDSVLIGIHNHNNKANHKYANYTITRISEIDFKAFKQLKDNPRFWDAFNGAKLS